MRQIEIGDWVLLHPVDSYIRCSEYKDDTAIRYHIVDVDMKCEFEYDIAADSRIAQHLLGRKEGDQVKLPLEDTDITFVYVINRIE